MFKLEKKRCNTQQHHLKQVFQDTKPTWRENGKLRKEVNKKKKKFVKLEQKLRNLDLQNKL